MATLPNVLISRADYQIGGGVALRLRTQGCLLALIQQKVRHPAIRCRQSYRKQREAIEAEPPRAVAAG
jgi:hypothetical protein